MKNTTLQVVCIALPRYVSHDNVHGSQAEYKAEAPGLVLFSAIAIQTPLAQIQLRNLVSSLDFCFVFIFLYFSILIHILSCQHTCRHRVREPPVQPAMSAIR